MTVIRIALALAAISAVVVPAAVNAAGQKNRPGGYIGVTTTGVKHWIPDPARHSKAWFQRWLERERRLGREYNFDSRG